MSLLHQTSSMRKALVLIGLVAVLGACQKNAKPESEIEIETPTSRFDITADMIDFKEKMTELDTLHVSFNHSMCMYQAYERLQITKKSDSIRIKSMFKDAPLGNDTDWEKIYEKNVHASDTVWKFSEFLNRNKMLKKQGENAHPVLIISSKKDTLRFYAGGLGEISRFVIDYATTMRALYPENTNSIYGVDIVEE